jgi:ABC-2 type transport system permease protein
MNKIWIIVQREYITRVKRRAFIITTLLAPVGFFLLLTSSFLINSYSQSRTDVAVVDETGLFKDIVIPDAEDQTVYFHKIEEPYDKVVQMLPKEKDATAKFQAVIYIPANFDINNPVKSNIVYRSTQRPGNSKREFINRRFSSALQQLRMKKMNVSAEELEKARQPIELSFESVGNSQETKGYADAAAIAGLVMGFAIYISLLFYGTMIMKGVMEEKSNRIVEVLTSSVKPFQLLMGKILGIGAVGLTQFILWILLTGAVNVVAVPLFGAYMANSTHSLNAVQNSVDSDSIENIRQNMASLPIMEMACLCPLYFLGGFLLYGALFAAIGSAMGEDSDQQSLTLPVMVPIIISIIIAGNVLNNPDSNLGFWGSIIPFTSPVVMCSLIPFRPVWWQVALSLSLLVAGFILTTLLAARIYRVAILMYGKKVTLKEMGKLIFAKQ